MATLRQRIFGKSPSEKEEKEQDDSREKAEEVRLVPISKIKTDASSHSHKHEKTKRRNGFIFFLGGLFGILAAGFFAQRNELIEFPELGDLRMDSFIDVLPAGFVKDARDLAVSAYFVIWVGRLGGMLGEREANVIYRKESEKQRTTILSK